MTSHGQPETRCWTCGRRTIARSGLCRACQRRNRQAHEAIALTGGRWVLRGGVHYWESEQPRANPEAQPVPKSLPKDACPNCGAFGDQPCRTPSGRWSSVHLARIAPRICVCGVDIPWKRKHCDKCRAEQRRAWEREYKKKRRRDVA